MAVIDRLLSAFDRLMGELERQEAGQESAPADVERAAKLLSQMSKTYDQLQASAARDAETTVSAPELDRMRAELGRRMDRLTHTAPVRSAGEGAS